MEYKTRNKIAIITVIGDRDELRDFLKRQMGIDCLLWHGNKIAYLYTDDLPKKLEQACEETETQIEKITIGYDARLCEDDDDD